jgi:hypothetical protein
MQQAGEFLGEHPGLGEFGKSDGGEGVVAETIVT